YLPPYSPDLNPIEQTFAKIKHWMRIAQKRTLEDIWRHLGDLVTSIQPTECSNYFANAGYASIKT
ncbi:transposase, partial [Bradyrhizobium sp. LeoA1S1]